MRNYIEELNRGVEERALSVLIRCVSRTRIYNLCSSISLSIESYIKLQLVWEDIYFFMYQEAMCFFYMKPADIVHLNAL